MIETGWFRIGILKKTCTREQLQPQPHPPTTKQSSRTESRRLYIFRYYHIGRGGRGYTTYLVLDGEKNLSMIQSVASVHCTQVRVQTRSIEPPTLVFHTAHR